MGMKQFFIGVKAIIIDDERGALLLKEQKNSDFVDVPGGRIDDNETFQQTLLREISEELPNVEVQSIEELLGAYRVPKDLKENTGLVLLFYRVRAKIPINLVLSNEHEEYIWVKDKNRIPEGVNEEIRKILIKSL